ncbi:hypothetical protein [Arthrobacter flavus]|uniref:HNH endonuclease n=1 Tax=Arthrobacter flavus TaxID=95172 RepID=A0ABW4Q7S6_9MICC
MEYYFANQATNYEQVILSKTLWTCPRPERKIDEARRLIHDLRRGDVILHYKDGALRAVSTVTVPAVAHPRPPEYPPRPGEGENGWLVLVEPLRKDINMGYKELGSIIALGQHGPLKSDGRGAAQGKFLSRVSAQDGHKLLDRLHLVIPDPDGSWLGRPPSFWDGDDSDIVRFGKARAEQQDLRHHLIAGRRSALCSLCSRDLPANLLIAAHIKPRSRCSEAERRDFEAVAMLVCNLGCDALFEWGYVAVDHTGHITQVRPSLTPHTEQAVSRLLGLNCPSHNAATAPHFASHLDLAKQRHLDARQP